MRSTQALPDTFDVVLQADAQPGRCTLAWKGRRDWGDKAINGSATIELRATLGRHAEIGPSRIMGVPDDPHPG